MQTTGTTIQQRVCNPIATSCIGASFYGGNVLNNALVKRDDALICHITHAYRAPHAQVDPTNFAFHRNSFLAVQKKSSNVTANA